MKRGRSTVDGHEAKRRLSQNFLRDLDARDAIAAATGVTAGTCVLEIGPGLGALTESLLGRGARVVAVEIDDDLIPRLQQRFAAEIRSGSLTLVHGDALQVDLAALVPSEGAWHVAANIPYHVTSPLLHRLLLLPNPAERIVLLVQLEVAERVAAPVGDWSYLTAFVQARTAPRILRRVPREAFEPEPSVDSAVLLLERRSGPDALDLDATDEDRLWRLVQGGFQERRKKLRNALPRALHLPPGRIADALATAGLSPDLRAQALGMAEWLRLLDALPDLAPLEAPAPARRYSTYGDPPAARRGEHRRSIVGPPGDGTVEERAPGKVNLTLAIVGRRDDGYHELHSVVAPLRYGDTLSLRIGDGPDDRLHLAGVPIDEHRENLVHVALRALRTAVDIPPLEIVLEKRLPVAAGLGGGSSDAAAAMRGALRLSGRAIDGERLRALAATVGSDVPLFLTDGVALIEGRGERVTPLAGFRGPGPGVLLVTAAVPLRTPDVFAAYAAGLHGVTAGGSLVTSRHLADELRGGLDAGALVQRAGVLAAANDLLAPARAVAPWLRPFGHALGRLLGRPIALSGSGPTLFVLYPSPGEAEAAREQVAVALADGTIVSPEGRAPSLIATALAAGEDA